MVSPMGISPRHKPSERPKAAVAASMVGLRQGQRVSVLPSRHNSSLMQSHSGLKEAVSVFRQRCTPLQAACGQRPYLPSTTAFLPSTRFRLWRGVHSHSCFSLPWSDIGISLARLLHSLHYYPICRDALQPSCFECCTSPHIFGYH